MISSCGVKEPLLLQTDVYSCSVSAAGRKVLWRRLGTGEDSALEAGPVPLPSALAPCLLAGRGGNAKFLQFLQYTAFDRKTGALHAEKRWWAVC